MTHNRKNEKKQKIPLRDLLHVTQRHMVSYMRMEVYAMSKYTTGEIAKLCGVTVRAVQYYDNRNILVPSELSEGGRRLYSEEDLRRLKIICFLRELGLSIDAIGRLLREEHPEAVISLLLKEREEELSREMGERREQLRRVETLQNELKGISHFTVESIGDIAYHMEHKKKLKRVRALMLVVGILMDMLAVGTAVLWIATGIWWPFAVGMVAVVALGVGIFTFYTRRTAYICPVCHTVFRPSAGEMFWASHTPRTRRLTCPQCGRKGYCVETYRRENAS